MNLIVQLSIVGSVITSLGIGVEARMRIISEADNQPIQEKMAQYESAARASLDSQLRTECMQFHHQDLEPEDRWKTCEEESQRRQIWWKWVDCTNAELDSCGERPYRPRELGLVAEE